jgi:ABC-2 type transport system permease protein
VRGGADAGARARPSWREDLSRTLRALPTMVKVGFADALAYRAEMVVWILAYTMPLIMLALWVAVAKEAPVGRFDERGFQAYFLATLITRLATGAWVVWDLNQEIRQGTLSMRLLRPVNPLLSFLSDNLGALPMRLAIVFPIFLGIVLWLGPGVLSHDPVQLALVPVTYAGAFLMTFTLMAAIGTLAFYWEQSLSVFDLYLGLYFVFSGYIMPLELFPGWLREVAGWLPFRYMLSFPVENLLGLVDRAGALRALAMQWGYVAVFTAALVVLWRNGVRRYGAFGG